MGNEQSTTNVNDIEDNDINNIKKNELIDGSTYGFRILGIQANSPASNLGLVSFLDFVISANTIRLDEKDSTFMEIIAMNEDKPIELKIYNIKSQTIRDVTLIPSRNWGGKGLLGLTIRFDNFENSSDHLLHVLEVKKNSPAEIIGLEPKKDYLLGTPDIVFTNPNDLYEEISYYIDRPFQCYVYNSETDAVRLVSILPNNRWSAEGDGTDNGILGIEVGYGLLHMFPLENRKTNGINSNFINIPDSAKAATDIYVKDMSANEAEEEKEETKMDSENIDKKNTVEIKNDLIKDQTNIETPIQKKLSEDHPITDTKDNEQIQASLKEINLQSDFPISLVESVVTK